MSNLNQGHVTNVEYTHGYYGELNPVRAAMALTLAGIAAPSVSAACELGFGQGVSVAIHSAAQQAEWWGTDFNPQHTASAQGLVGEGETASRFDERGFAEFCLRPDLPDFDFIGLHGVWSWISTENQDVIIEFVRRKLRPGGILYVSYNTLPGWSDVAPLRHLFKGHVDNMGAPGAPLFARMDASLAFLGKLEGVNPAFFRAAPRASERLKQLSTHNKNYVAHEYLTDHWNLTYYADFARRMADAKVVYACSANTLDFVDSINLTAEQQELLNSIEDPTQREGLRDFCINQQFRRDIWVKGATRLNAFERLQALRHQRIVLSMPREDIPMKVAGALGEATLHEDVYRPLLDFLADGVIRTVAEMEAAGLAAGVDAQKSLSAVPILIGMGALQIAQAPERVEAVTPTCKAIKSKIMASAVLRPDIAYLASPVTGGAVSVQRFEQMFLSAHIDGANTPVEWAERAWLQIAAMGQTLLKDGKALATPADNLTELTRQAQEFGAKKLPILRALGLV